MIRHILFIIILYVGFTTVHCQTIYQDINRIISNRNATVGVAVIYKDKKYTVANDGKYPLMSVFKLHIALAALKKIENENIPLDKKVYIEAGKMRKDTYSPLREKYPEQDINISYRDIIKYTVSLSDNNTCDWLIDFTGGIEKIDSYIKSLGIRDINLSETEYTMYKDIMNSYNNWATPLSVAQLLEKVYTEQVLTKEHFMFLEQIMTDTPTGKDKLKAGLPHNIRLAHKTGHSKRKDNNLLIADTDAGVIYLPNGEKIYIAVFIKDSKENDNDNAETIADIAKTIYSYIKGIS